jgi:hypothetical protein
VIFSLIDLRANELNIIFTNAKKSSFKMTNQLSSLFSILGASIAKINSFYSKVFFFFFSRLLFMDRKRKIVAVDCKASLELHLV